MLLSMMATVYIKMVFLHNKGFPLAKWPSLMFEHIFQGVNNSHITYTTQHLSVDINIHKLWTCAQIIDIDVHNFWMMWKNCARVVLTYHYLSSRECATISLCIECMLLKITQRLRKREEWNYISWLYNSMYFLYLHIYTEWLVYIET